jgi:hypothetical protein
MLQLTSKQDPVAYHKRQLRAAHDKMFSRRWYTPAEEFYCKLTRTTRRPPKKLALPEIQALVEQMNAARRALVKEGYLVERRFTVSNQSPNSLVWAVTSRRWIPAERARFGNVRPEDSAIVVTGFREDMATWEKVIRDADKAP